MARFLSKTEADQMAYSIAADWCEFALKCIKRGDKPARLSNQVQFQSYFNGEFQRPMYEHVERVSKERTAYVYNTAIHWAMQLIRNKEEFQPVLVHFAARTAAERMGR